MDINLCENCCKSDKCKNILSQPCNCEPDPPPPPEPEPEPSINSDCLSSELDGSDHDWMIGPWYATKADGIIKALVYFEYVPEYICKRITDKNTKNLFEYKQLIYYYFRIIADLDTVGIKSDTDSGWLGPFISKINIDGNLCVLYEGGYIETNGFEVLPFFPVGNGTSEAPGFIPDPDVTVDDPMYLKKGHIDVNISIPIYGNVGGKLNYKDLYDGKWWSCLVSNDDKKLTFKLDTDWMPSGKGTLTAYNDKSHKCIDNTYPISECYPQSVYSNTNQTSSQTCPVVDNLSWKIYVGILGFLFLVILIVIIIYFRKKI